MWMFLLGFVVALAIVLGIAVFLLGALVLGSKQKEDEQTETTAEDAENTYQWDGLR